jgi:hypothetical protein
VSPRELMLIGDDLKRCEKVIARARESIGNARLAAGSGYLEIRDGYCTHVKDSKGNPKKGLFHERGYTRFDTYCANEWGENVRDVNRAIELISTSKLIEEKVGEISPTPANAHQLRELAKAEDPVATWTEIVEQNAPEDITAAVIRDHVQAAYEPVNVVTSAPVAVAEPDERWKHALLSVVRRSITDAIDGGCTIDDILDVVGGFS